MGIPNIDRVVRLPADRLELDALSTAWGLDPADLTIVSAPLHGMTGTQVVVSFTVVNQSSASL